MASLLVWVQCLWRCGAVQCSTVHEPVDAGSVRREEGRKGGRGASAHPCTPDLNNRVALVIQCTSQCWSLITCPRICMCSRRFDVVSFADMREVLHRCSRARQILQPKETANPLRTLHIVLRARPPNFKLNTKLQPQHQARAHPKDVAPYAPRLNTCTP